MTHVARRRFSSIGQLRVEPLLRGCVIKAVALSKPPDLDLRRCVHDEHAGERRVALALVQQGNVDGHEWRIARQARGDALLAQLDDAWMRDPLEVMASLRVGEDDRTELLPIEASVGQQDVAAETLDDPFERRLARDNGLAGERVSVDHGGATRREHRANGALPRCDAPGEADESHRG